MKLSLNIKGDLMQWDHPLTMGILNLTPDSFFDGGKYQNDSSILSQVEKMLEEGADIIDIGGFSSRPGAKMITEEEEMQRVTPIVKLILKEFDHALLSIDTYRRSIAEECVSLGASIINDISGGLWDRDLPKFIAERNIPYIIMHMQGSPENMQDSPTYKDVSRDIYQWFSERILALDRMGIQDLIIDTGFGFGKSLEHNDQLLKDLSHFSHLKKPILAGISRKGMIQKVINANAANALNGSTAAHVIALLNGADILRVHDVKEAKEAIAIVDYYQKLNIVS